MYSSINGHQKSSDGSISVGKRIENLEEKVDTGFDHINKQLENIINLNVRVSMLEKIVYTLGLLIAGALITYCITLFMELAAAKNAQTVTIERYVEKPKESEGDE